MMENCIQAPEESIDDIDAWEEPGKEKHHLHSVPQASHLVWEKTF